MIGFVQRDDAAAYVLGAIGADEARAFERLMAVDTSLAMEVEALREVAALLAYAAPMAPVPGELRARVVETAKGQAESTQRNVASSILPPLTTTPTR